jgi:hypothetical protein
VLAKADVQLLPGQAEHLRGARLVVVTVLQACAASNTKQFRRTSTHTRSAEFDH